MKRPLYACKLKAKNVSRAGRLRRSERNCTLPMQRPEEVQADVVKWLRGGGQEGQILSSLGIPTPFNHHRHHHHRHSFIRTFPLHLFLFLSGEDGGFPRQKFGRHSQSRICISLPARQRFSIRIVGGIRAIPIERTETGRKLTEATGYQDSRCAAMPDRSAFDGCIQRRGFIRRLRAILAPRFGSPGSRFLVD